MEKSSYVKMAVLACLALFICAPLFMNAKQVHAKGEENPAINPKPQEITDLGKGFPLTPVVGLVIGENTDEQAVREVVDALKSADVKRIVRKKSGDDINTPVTIWIGGPGENSGAADVLSNLGIEGPAALKDEGYVLAAKNADEKQIVLAGKDKAGTFYAAQTFKQLILKRTGRDWVPAVEIRDWPEMPIRGSIEGFYGPPWTNEDRLSQIEFYGDNKLNTYIYAPKDDPYHREKWREPYPEDELAKLDELINKSNENHVQFTFSLSPGNTVCFSGDEDFNLLKDKMQKMWDLGVRSYAIFLDDISKSLHCEQDQEKFGDDENPVAAAHAYLLNRFNEAFIQTHDGAKRLITVPTEYAGSSSTAYRERFAELLHDDIVVMWTGPKVVSEKVTSEGAEKTATVFQHDLLLWDNYPVNDYDRNRLFLGPLVKRDANLTEHGVIGLTANPMNEAEASKIPLFTIADYTWNPKNYNPRESWERSIQSFGGEAADLLRTFAENSYSSPINNTESLTIKPLIELFWESYQKDNADQARRELIAEFEKLQQLPGKMLVQMENKHFLEEIDPYLEKLSTYGEAGELAVNYLVAEKSGNKAKARKYRENLIEVIIDTQNTPQEIGVGVIKPFLVQSALNIPPMELMLQPSIDAFMESYETGDAETEAAELIAAFEEMNQMPEKLREELDDEDFLKSVEPYLQNLDVYGKAGVAAVHYLMAKKDGQQEKADQYQDELRDLMIQVNEMPQKIGASVIKPFLMDSMWEANVTNYRELDGVNTFRGAGELIKYTPEQGERTGTNQWGYEVTVVDGVVVDRGGNNSVIPDDGYVLSIHANDWLRDNAKPGTHIQIQDNIVLIIEQ
ncbi:beta-N-acetylglucosaminidase domain-containing protein [Virgibacillus siamensis]|uniref:beta-N-acetylglucosaminidase domain-containing protein n=1 Tax=Virgibacillus siamensis TaxID=480071 RepID=UPI001FE9FE57|nr:beta-N-acetylglucosaminidase domain-containing protein [Virgibacillus siamensis]